MAYNHEKGLCWISHKHKLVFIGIPKNASTSIRNTFEITNYIDNYLAILKRNSKEKYYTTFTVIRYPLDRLVSGYIEVCERATGDSPKTLEKSFYWIRNQKKRFYAFIDEIENEKFDAHIEEQMYYLTDINGDLINIDFFLCMNSIKSDFENMCKILGLNCTLLRENEAGSIFDNVLGRFIKDIGKNYSNSRDILEAVFKTTLKALSKLKSHIELPLPNNSEIIKIIQNDENLKKRIFEIYQDDFKFYDAHCNTEIRVNPGP